MRGNTEVGALVALTSIKAWPQDPVTGIEDGPETTVSGLFQLIEFYPREPAAYVHSDSWLIARLPEAPNDTGAEYIVDAYDLWEQTDPKGYGAHLRELDLAEMAAEAAG